MDERERCIDYAKKMIALGDLDIYINPEVDILEDLKALPGVASVEAAENNGRRFCRLSMV